MTVNDKQIGGLHYQASNLQHWDWVVNNYGQGYLIGNVTKYLARHAKKNGAQDLRKAYHYVEKMIELAREGRIGPAAEIPVTTPAQQFCLENDLLHESKAICLVANWFVIDELEECLREIECLLEKFYAATP